MASMNTRPSTPAATGGTNSVKNLPGGKGVGSPYNAPGGNMQMGQTGSMSTVTPPPSLSGGVGATGPMPMSLPMPMAMPNSPAPLAGPKTALASAQTPSLATGTTDTVSTSQPPGGANLLGGLGDTGATVAGKRPTNPGKGLSVSLKPANPFKASSLRKAAMVPAPGVDPAVQPGTIYTPGLNGPVVNDTTVPDEDQTPTSIYPSPATPQPGSQEQAGQYLPQNPLIPQASYDPGLGGQGSGGLMGRLQKGTGSLVRKMEAQTGGKSIPAQNGPGKLAAHAKSSSHSPQGPASKPRSKKPATSMQKKAKFIGNNQDEMAGASGNKLRVVNSRLEGDGMQALYDDPEIARRVRNKGKAKQSSVFTQLGMDAVKEAMLKGSDVLAPRDELAAQQQDEGYPYPELLDGAPASNMLADYLPKPRDKTQPTTPEYLAAQRPAQDRFNMAQERTRTGGQTFAQPGQYKPMMPSGSELPDPTDPFAAAGQTASPVSPPAPAPNSPIDSRGEWKQPTGPKPGYQMPSLDPMTRYNEDQAAMAASAPPSPMGQQLDDIMRETRNNSPEQNAAAGERFKARLTPDVIQQIGMSGRPERQPSPDPQGYFNHLPQDVLDQVGGVEGARQKVKDNPFIEQAFQLRASQNGWDPRAPAQATTPAPNVDQARDQLATATTPDARRQAVDQLKNAPVPSSAPEQGSAAPPTPPVAAPQAPASPAGSLPPPPKPAPMPESSPRPPQPRATGPIGPSGQPMLPPKPAPIVPPKPAPVPGAPTGPTSATGQPILPPGSKPAPPPAPVAPAPAPTASPSGRPLTPAQPNQEFKGFTDQEYADRVRNYKPADPYKPVTTTPGQRERQGLPRGDGRSVLTDQDRAYAKQQGITLPGESAPGVPRQPLVSSQPPGFQPRQAPGQPAAPAQPAQPPSTGRVGQMNPPAQPGQVTQFSGANQPLGQPAPPQQPPQLGGTPHRQPWQPQVNTGTHPDWGTSNPADTAAFKQKYGDHPPGTRLYGPTAIKPMTSPMGKVGTFLEGFLLNLVEKGASQEEAVAMAKYAAERNPYFALELGEFIKEAGKPKYDPGLLEQMESWSNERGPIVNPNPKVGGVPHPAFAALKKNLNLDRDPDETEMVHNLVTMRGLHDQHMQKMKKRAALNVNRSIGVPKYNAGLMKQLQDWENDLEFWGEGATQKTHPTMVALRKHMGMKHAPDELDAMEALMELEDQHAQLQKAPAPKPVGFRPMNPLMKASAGGGGPLPITGQSFWDQGKEMLFGKPKEPAGLPPAIANQMRERQNLPPLKPGELPTAGTVFPNGVTKDPSGKGFVPGKPAGQGMGFNFQIPGIGQAITSMLSMLGGMNQGGNQAPPPEVPAKAPAAPPPAAPAPPIAAPVSPIAAPPPVAKTMPMPAMKGGPGKIPAPVKPMAMPQVLAKPTPEPNYAVQAGQGPQQVQQGGIRSPMSAPAGQVNVPNLLAKTAGRTQRYEPLDPLNLKTKERMSEQDELDALTELHVPKQPVRKPAAFTQNRRQVGVQKKIDPLRIKASATASGPVPPPVVPPTPAPAPQPVAPPTPPPPPGQAPAPRGSMPPPPGAPIQQFPQLPGSDMPQAPGYNVGATPSGPNPTPLYFKNRIQKTPDVKRDFGKTYGNALSKYYNPAHDWSQESETDFAGGSTESGSSNPGDFMARSGDWLPTDRHLRYGGRAALATAAAAGAAAASPQLALGGINLGGQAGLRGAGQFAAGQIGKRALGAGLNYGVGQAAGWGAGHGVNAATGNSDPALVNDLGNIGGTGGAILGALLPGSSLASGIGRSVLPRALTNPRTMLAGHSLVDATVGGLGNAAAVPELYEATRQLPISSSQYVDPTTGKQPVDAKGKPIEPTQGSVINPKDLYQWGMDKYVNDPTAKKMTGGAFDNAADMWKSPQFRMVSGIMKGEPIGKTISDSLGMMDQSQKMKLAAMVAGGVSLIAAIAAVGSGNYGMGLGLGALGAAGLGYGALSGGTSPKARFADLGRDRAQEIWKMEDPNFWSTATKPEQSARIQELENVLKHRDERQAQEQARNAQQRAQLQDPAAQAMGQQMYNYDRQ